MNPSPTCFDGVVSVAIGRISRREQDTATRNKMQRRNIGALRDLWRDSGAELEERDEEDTGVLTSGGDGAFCTNGDASSRVVRRVGACF